MRNRRTVAAVLALALIWGGIAPGTAQAQQSPEALLQYVADRIDAIVLDLISGRLSSAQAAAEVSDLQFIVAAGQLAFGAEIHPTLVQALVGLQGLLASAGQALAQNGSGDLLEAFLVRVGTAGKVAAAAAVALRTGLSSLTAPQLATLQGAAPGQATAVRAPDYRAPVAQDSVATVFVSRAVTGSRADGTFDANLRLPLTLSGATSLVGGQLAELFHVSPNQVNFLMPKGVPPGSAQVVVTGNNGAVATGFVDILATAPAIFTEDSSGRGTGAVLNGVTFSRGPFRVTTAENPGDDKRTRLAIFLTGIRNLPNTDRTNDIPLAGGETLVNVAESLRATIAGLSVPVEFGGRHPVFSGLDQVNVVLPAELAGRGTVDLVVSSGAQITNTVQVTIQ